MGEIEESLGRNVTSSYSQQPMNQYTWVANESAADEAETDEEWGVRLFTHTDDGRRFATPIRSAPFRRQLESVTDNSGNVESDPAWNNALNDGIVANAINRQHSNAQYLFREIDLRGVGIQQQKLGYRKAQVKRVSTV